MNKRNANILLGLAGLLALSQKPSGSASRAFMRSDRFHKRFEQMNNGVTFSSKVDEIRDVFVRNLFSFDWMRDSQIYANAKFPITDAVLNVNNLAGNPEHLRFEFRFASTPLTNDFQNIWYPLLSHKLARRVMTKKIMTTTAWFSKVASTGEKVVMGIGFCLLKNRYWKLIKEEYITNPEFKDDFNDGLNEMIQHELYHVIDPKKYKDKDEYRVSDAELSDLFSGPIRGMPPEYFDALSERSTWTNQLVKRFWYLFTFYEEAGKDDHLEMVMLIIVDPRGFWKDYYGVLLHTERREYGPMLANATQAIYTSLREHGINVDAIMKRNTPTFSQRWQETFESTNRGSQSQMPYSFLVESGKAYRYYDDGVSEVAHGIGKGDINAIKIAGDFLAKQVTPNDILVPMPSRHGFANTTLILADYISKISGARVVNCLIGLDRKSVYATKKQGRLEKQVDLGLDFICETPKHSTLFIIDNVIGTGYTMGTAQRLLPNSKPLVYAVDI